MLSCSMQMNNAFHYLLMTWLWKFDLSSNPHICDDREYSGWFLKRIKESHKAVLHCLLHIFASSIRHHGVMDRSEGYLCGVIFLVFSFCTCFEWCYDRGLQYSKYLYAHIIWSKRRNILQFPLLVKFHHFIVVFEFNIKTALRRWCEGPCIGFHCNGRTFWKKNSGGTDIWRGQYPCDKWK